MTEVDLIVTDGHDGLRASVSALFPATLRQRCLVHKQRNVMNAIPKREQQEVATELTGIWKQEKREDEEHVLTFYAFPQVMHRYIRSTNAHSELV
jgi:putative transposase